ncbi:leptin receptor gene-related protein [Arctopsyche grandis]|uniref:leptin receptor gene-related protein n=1 Tax=Arctopsyche grandis TaxID=121162 RepID=UPI00406D6E39
MTFVILACALPQYKLWWPLFVILFYILAPIPTLIARRHSEASSSSSAMEGAIFITMFIVISSFALPIVLARAPSADPTIHWGACYLTLAGNVFIYITMIIFFLTIDQEDGDYSS